MRMHVDAVKAVSIVCAGLSAAPWYWVLDAAAAATIYP